eukprot:3191528-Pyramimonas_sp.AAC.1
MGRSPGAQLERADCRSDPRPKKRPRKRAEDAALPGAPAAAALVDGDHHDVDEPPAGPALMDLIEDASGAGEDPVGLDGAPQGVDKQFLKEQAALDKTEFTMACKALAHEDFDKHFDLVMTGLKIEIDDNDETKTGLDAHVGHALHVAAASVGAGDPAPQPAPPVTPPEEMVNIYTKWIESALESLSILRNRQIAVESIPLHTIKKKGNMSIIQFSDEEMDGLARVTLANWYNASEHYGQIVNLRSGQAGEGSNSD